MFCTPTLPLLLILSGEFLFAFGIDVRPEHLQERWLRKVWEERFRTVRQNPVI